jgi:drug/metabolite transporter (DMT)-like permease
MTKVLIILLVALLFEAIGVVFLSRGLKEIREMRTGRPREILTVLKLGATHGSILTGIAFEAVFFGALLYLLSQRDVSLIWPLTSLGFVITALAARWVLHEQVSWVRWSGVALIVVGAGLVSYSESLKSSAADSHAERPLPVRDRI